MFRVEIIANHSVEENILEAFSQEGVGKYYTKYPNVFGVGHSGPRMGDAVWPEENFSLVLWCEEDEAQGVARAVAAVKSQFPDEGIRIFGLPDPADRFPHAAAFADESGFRPPQGLRLPAEPPAAPVHPASSYTPPANMPSPVYTLPQAAPPVYQPPVSGINAEYDGQNMDEEH
jgi:hypothetical protein